MRRKFLPWVWEHMQYLYFRLPGLSGSLWSWFVQKMFATHSRVLIRTPALAAHVEYVPLHLMGIFNPCSTSSQELYLSIYQMLQT